MKLDFPVMLALLLVSAAVQTLLPPLHGGELALKAPAAVDAQFKGFVKALVDKGVRVVVDTRSPVEPIAAALAEFGLEGA